MSELALIENSPAQLSETGLSLPENLSRDEWAEVGSHLGRAHKASAWWIGDWINHGERKWGEIYDEAGEITGLTNAALRQYAWVSRTFPNCSRATTISFSVHRAIAAAPESERAELLGRAAEEGWSSRNAREHIIDAGVPLRVMPGKRHETVVAAVDHFVALTERWERPMTDALTPPEAKKQLTILRKAEAVLAEVIEAVEYRAATLHDFNH